MNRVFVAADLAGTATQFFKPRTAHSDLEREPERDTFFEDDVRGVQAAGYFKAFIAGHFDFDVDVLFVVFLCFLPAFGEGRRPFVIFLDGLVEQADPSMLPSAEAIPAIRHHHGRGGFDFFARAFESPLENDGLVELDFHFAEFKEAPLGSTVRYAGIALIRLSSSYGQFLYWAQVSDVYFGAFRPRER